MFTSASKFFSGELDPFWPHVVLLSVAVLASIAVGAGIIFERPKYSAAVHRIAFWLVVSGIAIEAVCTIFLFVFDEGISQAQQNKIISLSARSWTKAQFDAIQEIKGKVTDVGVIAEKDCLECRLFADHIELALHSAGVRLYGDLSIDLMRGTGIHVTLPVGSDLFNDPLVVALRNAGLYPGASFHNPQWSPVRTDIRVIFVGEKFPLMFGYPYYPGERAQWTYLPLKNPNFVPPTK